MIDERCAERVLTHHPQAPNEEFLHSTRNHRGPDSQEKFLSQNTFIPVIAKFLDMRELLIDLGCVLRHSTPMEFLPLVSALAAVVGLLVGLTGVGAGALMTPILIVGFGVSPPVAIATDLLYATITKTVGGAAHMRAGHIQWKLLRPLWWGGIFGALVGAAVVVTFVHSDSVVDWLTYPLAAIVALAAISLFRRHWRATGPEQREGDAAPPHRAIAVSGGAGIGLAVSLTSVGAGALGMALLTKLSPRGTPPHKLVGTDLLLAIPIALMASGAYLMAGIVDLSLLGNLLVGSLPGVVIGSLLSSKMPGRPLGLLVAGALSVAVVALLLS